jgi:hypothetical protein
MEFAKMSKLNWSAIAKELEPRKTTRIQSSDLALRDFYVLKVMAKIKKRSMADDCASILSCAVRRLLEDWEELLIFEAAQRGITPEELFVELLKES